MVLSPFRQLTEQTACIIKSVHCSYSRLEKIDLDICHQAIHTLNAPAFWKKRCKDIN